jgi:hypothetical protein
LTQRGHRIGSLSRHRIAICVQTRRDRNRPFKSKARNHDLIWTELKGLRETRVADASNGQGRTALDTSFASDHKENRAWGGLGPFGQVDFSTN